MKQISCTVGTVNVLVDGCGNEFHLQRCKDSATDEQTNRWKNIQAKSKKGKKESICIYSDGQRVRQTDRQRNRQTNMNTDRPKGKCKGIHTVGLTDKQTERDMFA